MIISLVVAASENNVIGNKGKIPWHLPLDLKHFRELTEGHTIIMGRKTYESIGHSLPHRRNIVISRQEAFKAKGCKVVSSLDEALRISEGEQEVFVIGGGEIYKQALPHADRIYLTRVHIEVDGDAFFPELDGNKWKEVSSDHHGEKPEQQPAFTFVVYDTKGNFDD